MICGVDVHGLGAWRLKTAAGLREEVDTIRWGMAPQDGRVSLKGALIETCKGVRMYRPTVQDLLTAGLNSGEKAGAVSLVNQCYSVVFGERRTVSSGPRRRD